MTYIDGIFLVSDTIDEMHTFATLIELPDYMYNVRLRQYEMTTRYNLRAVDAGAQWVTANKLSDIRKAMI